MIQLKNTSLWRPQWNGFLLTICWFIAKLAHPLYLTTDNETRHYMQFSLKSSLCRFIRKSFVGIFKMNTDSCFRHPRDGTSCHRTLEDLASWTRRPRFSGRRPQDCNCCRVTQYRRVGVLHQVTQGFCSPPQLLSPLLSDSPPQLATPKQLFWVLFFSTWPLFGWLFWALSWICLCTRESFFWEMLFWVKTLFWALHWAI